MLQGLTDNTNNELVIKTGCHNTGQTTEQVQGGIGILKQNPCEQSKAERQNCSSMHARPRK